MAVRFLPPPEERPTPHREDTGNLAEVIEFRSKLRRPEPVADAEAEPASAPPSAWASTPERSDGPGSTSGWAQAPRSAEAAPAGAGAPLASGTGTDADADTDADAGAAAAAGDDGGAPATHSWARLIEAPFGRSRNAGTHGVSGAGLDGSVETDAETDTESGTDTWSRLGPAVEPGFAQDPGFAQELPEDPEDLEDGPTAYETAVKLLARKPLSSGELQRALVAAGHPEIDAEEAVAKCEDSLYLDDVDLANSVATKLRDSKGESKARIRQKLRERYLPDAAIEAALEGLDDDAELELLKQTAVDRARRMTGLDRQTAERRLLGFLARRGWSGERATRAAKEALDGAGSSGGGRGTVRFR